MSGRNVLEVEGLVKDFGGLRAVDTVSLSIRGGEIVALIGPNGAGKTTFFNCITGIYKPTAGEVRLTPKGGEPKRLNGLKPNAVTSLGMARTFQNIRLFPNMTVLENVMVGTHCRSKTGVLGAIFRPPSVVREEADVVRRSFALLKKFGLETQANNFARNLPYAAQRRLEIARALATEPSVLLLDEPAAGMNPQETRALDELIGQIRDELGLAILLIEHDMKLVMSISDRITVMEYGKQIAEGRPEEIQNNRRVIKAYLGEDVD